MKINVALIVHIHHIVNVLMVEFVETILKFVHMYYDKKKQENLNVLMLDLFEKFF